MPSSWLLQVLSCNAPGIGKLPRASTHSALQHAHTRAAAALPAGKRIKCSQLHGPGVLLLGDAAHAVTPVFGQGANSALESCKVLGAALGAAAGDLDALPAIYDKQRRADAHSLCDLDAKAFSFFSKQGWGEPGFVALLLHVMVGSLLSKLVPGMYGPKPALLRLGSLMPYSEIGAAVERDSVIAVGLMGLLALGVFAAIKAARMFLM
jgi:kynurenine 3-monooxygenase